MADRFTQAALAQIPVSGSSINRPYMQPLYDTEVVAQATPGGTITWFQKPQGQNLTYQATTVAKTEWHTNMLSAGLLAAPNQFWLFGFRVEPEVGITAASHLAIEKWGVFKWFFGSNVWLRIPLSQVPQGVSHDGYGGSTAYPRQGAALPIFFDFRIKGAPVKIEPNTAFRATLEFPAGSAAPYADTYIRCYALGVLEGQL